MNFIKAKQILESAGKKLVREKYETSEEYYIEKYEPWVGEVFEKICDKIKAVISEELGEVEMTYPEAVYDGLTTFGKDPIVNCSVKYTVSEEESARLMDLSEKEWEAEGLKIEKMVRKCIGEIGKDWDIDFEFEGDLAKLTVEATCIVAYDSENEREYFEWQSQHRIA